MERIHEKEKTELACAQCDKKFISKGGLDYHVKTIHEGIKQHKCFQCSFKTNHKPYMKVHLRVHNGEKPYQCHTCGKSYTQSSSLTVHMRVHTDEKHKCPQCNFKTAYKHSLKSHLRTHTKCLQNCLQVTPTAPPTHSHKGPFVCQHCDRRFPLSSDLNKHVRTVHSIQVERHACGYCNEVV